jgi:hypothetical protein
MPAAAQNSRGVARSPGSKGLEAPTAVKATAHASFHTIIRIAKISIEVDPIERCGGLARRRAQATGLTVRRHCYWRRLGPFSTINAPKGEVDRMANHLS